MPDHRILYKILPLLQGGNVANAENIFVDDSSLANVTADNSQQVASELNRLFGIVSSISVPQQSRPLTTFSGAVTVTQANFATYQNRNAVYVAATDQRVNFLLPTEANIPSGQYPVTFEISHFGGTQRFDSGAAPTNTIVVDTQGTDVLQLPNGNVVNFAELHRGDTGIITKSAAGQPWVVVESQADPRTSLLPNGVFNLRNEKLSTTTTTPNTTALSGFGLTSPVKGYAYEVSVDITGFGTVPVQAGDVIVAKVDNPNRVISPSNTDWIVIKDTKNFPLTMAEIRFLSKWSEDDITVASDTPITNTRFWLLDDIPITPPLLTDAQNDKYNNTNDNLLKDKVLLIAIPATLDPTKVVFRNKNPSGEFYETKLSDSFVLKTDIGTVSNRAYYMLGTGLTAYNPFLYALNHELTVHNSTDNREYTATNVNVTSGIKDLPLSSLDPGTQVQIVHGQTLNATAHAKLAGFTTDSNRTVFDSTSSLMLVYGDLAPNPGDGAIIQLQNRIIPNYRAQKIQLLVNQGANITSVRKITNTSQTLQYTYKGDVDLGFGIALSNYEITTPAVPIGDTLDSNAYEVTGFYDEYTLNGANGTFKVERNNISGALEAWIQSQGGNTPTPYTLPEALQNLLQHMTITHDTTSTWQNITPSPYRFGLTRQFAAFWDEDRSTFTDNYFTDITGVNVTINNLATYYYTTPNDSRNTQFPGAQSYSYNDNVRVRNTTGSTPITTSSNKIIGFDYALSRQLSDTTDLAMLRVGPTASTALMGISGPEGLYINIGRGDGGQRSRTYLVPLQVDNNAWHKPVSITGSLNEEAEVIIPNDATGSYPVTVQMDLSNNGNDVGTHTETVTIPNVGQSSNSLGQKTYTWTNPTVNLVVSFSYEHNNTDIPGITRRVLLVTATINNSAYTWYITAGRSVTETWNAPTTYARQQINAGDGLDDFGLFDPHNYHTEHVHERNRVLLSFQTWRTGDTSSDPEMAVRIIVDGQDEGLASDGYLIRLHRPRSDFTFNDINFGNSQSSIAHIQCYDYTGSPPNQSELRQLYGASADWMGIALPPGQSVDRIALSTDLELTAGHSIILTDKDSNIRKKLQIDDDDISISNA